MKNRVRTLTIVCLVILLTALLVTGASSLAAPPEHAITGTIG